MIDLLSYLGSWLVFAVLRIVGIACEIIAAPVTLAWRLWDWIWG